MHKTDKGLLRYDDQKIRMSLCSPVPKIWSRYFRKDGGGDAMSTIVA